MENVSNIQEERKQIRQQLDKAYHKQDEEEVIKVAKQLSELTKRIIKTKY